jgi:predicted N-acetyltransferase YhbS
MFERLASLFLPRDAFRIPHSRRPLPTCGVRSLRESDYSACEEIYRSNEAGRFPEGYFPRFSDWLRNHRALIVVAEVAGEVRGLGGINSEERAGQRFAALSFGMVHPEHHQSGFGTTLLLSRLSLLSLQGKRCTVMLSTVGGSETFYGRFGFRYLQSIPDQGGYAGDTYIARLAHGDPERCALKLNRARLAPELWERPIPSFAALSPVASASSTCGDELTSST